MQKFYLFLVLGVLTLRADAQLDTLRLYTYLNSTFDHRPPLNPTPHDETTVPFWLKLLADETGDHYESTGEFGTLSQWAGSLPPGSELGYDTIPGFWDAEITPFSAANFNTAIVMPLNYQQDRRPNVPYYGDAESPIDYTTTLFEDFSTEEPGIQMYIYELWPDMAGFLRNGFPPSDQEWDDYNDYLNGNYHDWFIEYNDSLVVAFPDDCVSMIPVGPAISALLDQAPYDDIPIDSLYEDDAPHGRPTIYFLAALTTYMAMHEVQAPATYDVPSIIHSTIVNNYADVVDILWNELQDFNDPDGDTRVFCSQLLLPVEYLNFYGSQVGNQVILEFMTATELNNSGFEVQRSADALNWITLDFIPASTNPSGPKKYTLTDQAPMEGRNHYRIKQIDLDNRSEFSEIISLNFISLADISFYPNPAHNTLYISRELDGPIQILNQLGVVEREINTSGTQVDLSGLSNGVYTLRWRENNKSYFKKIFLLR